MYKRQTTALAIKSFPYLRSSRSTPVPRVAAITRTRAQPPRFLSLIHISFEAGTVFLPQLLMSAEAARAAFGIMKEKMTKDGVERENRGTVILATVKGDIHDIGKNIVKVLLENYGFQVMDLGRRCV